MAAVSDRTWDVLVVGGGVIGLSIAWELAVRARRVCLVEASQIGRGASWAGAGILPPAARRGAVDPYDQLKALSHQLHPTWAKRLLDETGIDTGFARCGGIYLATTPAEAATLAGNSLLWQEHDIEHERWSEPKLLASEPGLAACVQRGVQAAWYLPDECQLRNPRHLQALAAACAARGVELLADCAMSELLIDDGQVLGVRACERVFRAAQVCICSGAWARQTLESLGLESGIMPVRGQMVLYNSSAALIQRIINEGHRYLVPRSDGRLLAGSVEEEVGYRIETTEAAIHQIRNWAEGVLPQLKSCKVERSWAGLRPGSYDGLPYLGGVPGLANLFVAAGHYRSGLHLSCATAVVMADSMLGEACPIDLRAFRVGR